MPQTAADGTAQEGGPRLRMKQVIIAAAIALCLAAPASAHFGMLLPSDDIVSLDGSKTIKLTAIFLHPFEGMHMSLAKPAALGVEVRGKRTSLLPEMKEIQLKGSTAYELQYTVKTPGDHVFYMEMAPYWESTETKFIVHFPKVIVSGLGRSGGWDKPLGLKAEIVPMARPYGLWAGNLMQGRVLYDGRPVPGALVEVEYYNPDAAVHAPDSAFITQSIHADENGVFTYAMPREGWWGFSAVIESRETISRNGKPSPVEHAAVLWVRTRSMR